MRFKTVAANKQAAERIAPLRVSLSRGVAGVIPTQRVLARWAGVAAAGRVRKVADLGLRVVGAAEGRALNRRFRGRDYATNVLSFGASGAARSRDRLLGDLVICAPVVAREARTQGKDLRAHWAHLVIHGTLHLLGYDHQRASDAERMERRETKLLRALGYADPYEHG
jgi:probable rRNA maturation factor